MTSREEQTREFLPESLDPYDEVMISKRTNNTRKYHLIHNNYPKCKCNVTKGFKRRELIQIVPTYTICDRCEDHLPVD